MNAHMIALPRTVVCLRALIILTLIMVLMLPRSVPSAAGMAAPRVQPALLDLAAQRPGALVDVIVRSAGNPAATRQAIMRLGGEVTGSLALIGALTARIQATAIQALGQMSGVRWVSYDAPMVETACDQCVDTSRLRTSYPRTVGADRLWNEGPKYLQGQGIGVAVIDSGINPQQDFYTRMGQNRLVAAVHFNDGYNQNVYDAYGHGNHVAGIIGGGGGQSNGAYIGIAPSVNLINVKVSDDNGSATMSKVIQGLQWIHNNRSQHNIRVLNMSMNSSVVESYHTNPLDAALEILWFSGIVVVVSAGNNANSGVLYPPANDPFLITVGATDDKGTPNISDDTLASFSGYGTTTDGFAKPDLVAPGYNLVSLMNQGSTVLSRQHPANIVDSIYFRMSGTSMSAPVVAGAVALLLQDEPNLTPHQVKYRLKATARPFDSPTRAGAGYLDVYAAVNGTTTQTANNSVPISRQAWEWAGGTTQSWNSVSWMTVNWSQVSWMTGVWSTVSWMTVNWSTVSWMTANWSASHSSQVSWMTDYWGN